MISFPAYWWFALERAIGGNLNICVNSEAHYTQCRHFSYTIHDLTICKEGWYYPTKINVIGKIMSMNWLIYRILSKETEINYFNGF